MRSSFDPGPGFRFGVHGPRTCFCGPSSGKDFGHLVGTLVDIRFLGNSRDSRYTRKAGPKARPAFGVHRESWEFRWKRNSPGNGFEDMSS